MTKRIISAIISLCIIISCLPVVVFASEEKSFLINECFENYPTNGLPDSVAAKTGIDTRVVEFSKSKKALYSKAQGEGIKLSVPIEKTYSKMVFSFDIRIDGAPVKGEILSLKGGSGETKLFSLSQDRSIKLEDGMIVSGYASGKWINYAVIIDYDKKCYDLYIDGKLKSSKRKFYTAPVKPKEIGFNLLCVNEADIAEVYLDNIRVYEGTKLLKEKDIPKYAYNSEVLEFTPGEIKEQTYDTVFIDSNSKTGIGSFSFVAKEGTVAKWDPIEEGGTPYIHFIKEGEYDTYGDLTPTTYEGLNKYVFQTDIYPVANPTANIIICRSNADGGAYSNLLYMTGSNLVVGSDVICKLDYKKWTTVAIACNLLTETGDVYVNGNLMKSDVPLPNGAVVPKYFRMGFTSGSAAYNEVYFNKIKFYDGLKIREFDDTLADNVGDVNYEMLESMKRTQNETDDMAIKLLGNDIVLMTHNNKLFENGKKSDYSAWGKASYLTPDGRLMADCTLLSKLLSANISGDENGFADVAAEARKLNKYVYEDNRGFVIISDSNKGYSNSTLSIDNQEEIDLIYRYMQYDRPTGDELYDKLVSGKNYKSHPRLFVTKEELPNLRSRINNNPSLKKDLLLLIDKCDTYLEKPPTKYYLVGIRLFSACYEVKQRLMDLSTAYLITQDKKYADRAWKELENCLNWEDFNLQTHFLDSGEIGPGIAIAYDFLYDYLTDEQKAFVRERLTELYLDYCVGVYSGNSNYKALEYRNVQSNWGMVCGTSMFMVASTLMDEEEPDSILTQKCKYIAANALQTMEHIHTAVAPEGKWDEGMGYFEYIFEHTGWSFITMKNVYGDDFEFYSAPGVGELVEYAMFNQTLNGAFNYSSIGPGIPKTFAPEVYVFGKLYGDKNKEAAYNDFYNMLGLKTYLARYLLFCDPSTISKADYSILPLDRYYKTNGIGIMKGSWEDSGSLYVGVSGGRTDTYNSCHYDKGSFIFEALGERWIIDMGRNGNDTYPFLKRTETHSALVINPDGGYGQEFEKDTKIIRVESQPTEALMIYDLTEVYGTKTKGYKRGFLVSDNRNTLTVQDELNLTNPSALQWNLITGAEVKISPDLHSATLTQGGETLKIDVYCSAPDWKLEYVNLEPFGGFVNDEQKAFAQGKGKLRLVCNASGNVTISAKFTPVIKGEFFAPHSVKPMDSWTLSNKAMPPKAQLNAIYLNGTLIDGFSPALRDYIISVPYGSAVPLITASANEGKVIVNQISNFTQTAVIKVVMEDGREAEYTINFRVSERITDSLVDTKPQLGLPSSNRLLDVKSIYASYEPQPANNAQNAIDGDFSTRWSADAKGAYMEVDLGDVYDLSGIALAYADGTTRNYRYEILVSEDKMDYKRVFIGESVGGTEEYEFLSLPVRARYVRYIGNQHKTGNWNSITEFRPTVAN